MDSAYLIGFYSLAWEFPPILPRLPGKIPDYKPPWLFYLSILARFLPDDLHHDIQQNTADHLLQKTLGWLTMNVAKC